MWSFVLTTLIMFIFWFLLSWQVDPILLPLGLVSSLLVAYWSHDLLMVKMNRTPDLGRIIRMIRFMPWLFWQIILANLVMVYLVLHPKMPIEPTLVRFKHHLKTDLGIVILANSITLTPGTLTIQANREEFIVHAISKDTAAGLMEMHHKVQWIESG